MDVIAQIWWSLPQINVMKLIPHFKKEEKGPSENKEHKETDARSWE